MVHSWNAHTDKSGHKLRMTQKDLVYMAGTRFGRICNMQQISFRDQARLNKYSIDAAWPCMIHPGIHNI